MAGENCELLCATTQMKSLPGTDLASDVSKGDLWIEGELVVFALDDADAGAEIGLCYSAEKAQFPKEDGVAIAQGERVFLDYTTNEINKDDSGRAMGWCRKDAASDDTTVEIDFEQELESATY